MMAGIIIKVPTRSSFPMRWIAVRLSGLFSRWMKRKKNNTITAIAPMGRLWDN